jgi:hypothetical protein
MLVAKVQRQQVPTIYGLVIWSLQIEWLDLGILEKSTTARHREHGWHTQETELFDLVHILPQSRVDLVGVKEADSYMSAQAPAQDKE